MSWLELKVPPPAAGLCVALLMWFGARLAGAAWLPHDVRFAGALLIGCVGFALDVAGAVEFLRAKTTVNPLTPASTRALVQTGVYRFSRNPMYLGQLLVLLGWATWLGNGLAYLCAMLYVLYINRFQIAPEERILAAKFGAAFLAYKQRVRRWL